MPVFTYAKSARFTFSASGSRRWSRSSRVTRRRCSRSFAGAAMTTTSSNRSSPRSRTGAAPRSRTPRAGSRAPPAARARSGTPARPAVQQALEKVQLRAVGEDDLGDAAPVDLAVRDQHNLAHSRTISFFTSSSSRSRWWTISSLEMVAAPFLTRVGASLFPAPIPPVIATATSRGNLRCVGSLGLVARCSIRLGGQLVHGLVACAGLGVGGRLGLELDLGGGVGLRRRRVLELRLCDSLGRGLGFGSVLGLGLRSVLRLGVGFGFGSVLGLRSVLRLRSRPPERPRARPRPPERPPWVRDLGGGTGREHSPRRGSDSASGARTRRRRRAGAAPGPPRPA